LGGARSCLKKKDRTEKRGAPLPEDTEISVQFWGVRGSIACPGEHYSRYGGNTSCLEVRCDGHVLIFDAGTGLRSLGEKLSSECGERGRLEADIYLTHTHIDHIAGIPFFTPLFNARNRIHMHAGHLQPEHSLHEVICRFMSNPLFPVPVEVFEADSDFVDFEVGVPLEPRPGVRLLTAPLNHPNRATGYRVEFAGKSLCFVTDTEHKPGRPDENVLGLIAGADLVIYDSSYTDDEFPGYRGWGHSTWQEGVRLVELAGAKRLVLFHHDPSHDDDVMDRIAREAEERRPGTITAREGMVLTL
jgi:phosphoribosyl 1,2-cyclic phosphodiesterase